MIYPEQRTAFTEGWGVFEASGSESNADGRREFQVQADSEAGLFHQDEEAWIRLVEKSNQGSAYHRYTLRFLREESPAEFESIIAYALQCGIPEIIMQELPYEPEPFD